MMFTLFLYFRKGTLNTKMLQNHRTIVYNLFNKDYSQQKGVD